MNISSQTVEQKVNEVNFRPDKRHVAPGAAAVNENFQLTCNLCVVLGWSNEEEYYSHTPQSNFFSHIKKILQAIIDTVSPGLD
jgi:hypothetical protein